MDLTNDLQGRFGSWGAVASGVVSWAFKVIWILFQPWTCENGEIVVHEYECFALFVMS